MAHAVFSIVERILMKYVRHDYMRCNYLYYCHNLFDGSLKFFLFGGSARTHSHIIYYTHILLCLGL